MAGVRIGQDYPAPIVDHAFARQRGLRMYAQRRWRSGKSVLELQWLLAAKPEADRLGVSCDLEASRDLANSRGSLRHPVKTMSNKDSLSGGCADGGYTVARLRYLSLRIRSWIPARESSLRSPFRLENECLAG